MKSFDAVHPTIGAGASLVAGREGNGAGLRTRHGGDRKLSLIIGVRQDPSLPWRILPLHDPDLHEGDEPFETLSGARYGRTFALASDRWLIGPLVFKLCTPFWKTSDPASCSRDESRLHFAPSIGGFVEYDNTHSEESVEVIVGACAAGAGFRPIPNAVRGFASSFGFGFATSASTEVRMRLGNTPFSEGGAETGDSAALVFTIPAHTKRVHPFSFGFSAPAANSAFFSNLEDVLGASLASNAEIVRRADELDSEWFAAPLSHDRRQAVSHAVRAHLGSGVVENANGAWKITRPGKPASAAFDAEFFPWAGESSEAASESWIRAWTGLPC